MRATARAKKINSKGMAWIWVASLAGSEIWAGQPPLGFASETQSAPAGWSAISFLPRTHRPRALAQEHALKTAGVGFGIHRVGVIESRDIVVDGLSGSSTLPNSTRSCVLDQPDARTALR